VPSRNQVKHKSRLRDLSRLRLTSRDRGALIAAVKDTSPIGLAILGAVLIEHELEALLRSRFARKDEKVWLELVADNGPLSTFFQKIVAGYAFRLYDDATKKNLHIVRNIRNAFAHSKKVIDFDHPLIVAELKNIRIPKIVAQKKIMSVQFSLTRELNFGAKKAYLDLCYLLGAMLIKKQTNETLAKRRKHARK
jgi:hypothetical protein